MRGIVNSRVLVVVTCASILCLVAVAVAQQGGWRWGGRGADGPGGGFGGGGFAVGTVYGTDVANGLIGLQQMNGQQIMVAVTPQTRMTREVQATPSELQLGQTISVNGLPVSLLAQEIRLDPPRDTAEAGSGPAVEGEQPATGGPGGDQGQGRLGGRGGARVTGQIISLQPFVIQTRDGQQVAVTLMQETSLVRSAETSIVELVQGEQVVVIGQTDENGVLQARTVQIGDLNRMMGRFMGGFGGGRGAGSWGRLGGAEQ